MIEIVNMNTLTRQHILDCAQILTDGLPLGWETLEDALAEIDKRLVPKNILLAALRDGTVVGFGGILSPSYHGNVAELHPLVVRADCRGQGVGRKIVEALEDAARGWGCRTMYLGADDEREGGETSFANADLYDDLPGMMRAFDPGTHQSGFYLKLGYKIVGVLPDANGDGKPDIFFAKRL